MPDSNLSELTPQVAIVFLFLVFLWKAGSKFVESLDKLTEAQNRSVDATRDLVSETRKGNEEAKERNGHLGEQNIQITELITSHTQMVADSFNHVQTSLDKQIVKEQTVEHQTVKE